MSVMSVRWFGFRVGLGLVLALTTAASAQRHHDPFTPAEIDQIRDASWEPQQRLTLYLKFARARLVALEQMRVDPKTKNRAHQTQDGLDNFQVIYEELTDNRKTCVTRRTNLPKPLKLVIDAAT